MKEKLLIKDENIMRKINKEKENLKYVNWIVTHQPKVLNINLMLRAFYTYFLELK